MRLTSQVILAAEVTAIQRETMLDLMDRHYENVRRECFLADLQEKQWVIMVRDPHGKVCGFSTQRLLNCEVDGRSVTALFSGDTVVARDRWGDSALAHAWGRLALKVIDDHPGVELYWFLLSKGYRTYRYLPLFFHEFDPNPGRKMALRAARVIDALATSRFGNSYDPATKIILANDAKDRLRPGIADVTAARLQDPYIRFFVERNPGHVRGDELCCLATLSRQNFTTAAWRVINPQPEHAEAEL